MYSRPSESAGKSKEEQGFFRTKNTKQRCFFKAKRNRSFSRFPIWTEVFALISLPPETTRDQEPMSVIIPRSNSFSSAAGALSTWITKPMAPRLSRSSSETSLERASVDLANGRALVMNRVNCREELSSRRVSQAMSSRKRSHCSVEEALKTISRGSFEIEPAEIEFGTKIGDGATAVVVKSTWRGKECAVKMLKFGTSPDTPEYYDLVSELSIMTKIGSHRNLVQFYGAQIRDPALPLIVQELVDGPDLDTYLRSKPQGFDLGRKTTFRWMLDILSALDHLHDRDPIIMHRDLKPANILLAHNLKVLKLTDFGLAKQFSQEERLRIAHAGYTGTLRYMAPEVIGYFSRSESDVGDWYSKKLGPTGDSDSPRCVSPFAALSRIPSAAHGSFFLEPEQASGHSADPAAASDDDDWPAGAGGGCAGTGGGGGNAAVYTEKADIYSASLVLWYLLTGFEPSVDVRVNPRGRPSAGVAKGRSLDIGVLLECMWHPCPENRPSAGDCLDYLHALPGGAFARGCGAGCATQ